MRKLLRRLTWLFGITLITSSAALVGGYYWLRGSLPNLEGNQPVAGLEAPVEVLRDAYGIVTIRAESEGDAYVALGYVHAQDRLWQMDMMRRTGAGRVSEVVGADTLELDRYLRGLGLYRLAEASLEHLPPEVLAALEAYTAGVNALLAEPGRLLPPEFLFLRHEPEPWRPADSLVWGRLMALQLSNNWRGEILRRRLDDLLTPEQLDLLWPEYPKDGPITVGSTGASSWRHADAASPDRLTAGAGANSLGVKARSSTPPLADLLPLEWSPKDASNAWVLSGAHTQSGKPILANDLHLGLTAPGPWYLARIETPELTLAGATAPGVPFHLLGHNGRIAWGFTTTHADTQDFFIERLSKKRRGYYETPRGPRRLKTRQETIRVRGEDPETITIRETRHGPVISELRPDLANDLPEDRVLALAWSALRPDDRSAAAFYALNRARNWESFLAAMEDLHSPVQNVFYADTDGNIGFLVAGRIPVRKTGIGRTPAPGWSGRYDWDYDIPFARLPRSRNPATGRIVNANNRVVDAAYPFLITARWPDAWRARRIEGVLDESGPTTVWDNLALQLDILSLAARELLPLLLRNAQDGSAEAAKARDLLGRWDHSMARDRPEPLIFYAWMAELNRILVADELEEHYETFQGTKADLLLAILTEDRAWCDDVTTAEAESCEGRVALALETALDGLTGRFGSDMEAWRWGAAHVARFPHPALGSIPIVGGLFGFPVEADGGFYTVNRGAARLGGPAERRFTDFHGATLRAVYNLADLDNSRFSIATGQSGNPLSPFYGSLVERWRDGQTVKLVGPATEPVYRLVLQPR